MKATIPPEEQLAALEHRASVAEKAGRETVSVKPESLMSLAQCARALRKLVTAARREVAATGCWCANWPGPGKQCSWCQLKHAIE